MTAPLTASSYQPYAAPQAPTQIPPPAQGTGLLAALGLLNRALNVAAPPEVTRYADRLKGQLVGMGKQAVSDPMSLLMGMVGTGDVGATGGGTTFLHELIGKSGPEVESIFAKTIADDKGLLARLFGEEGAKKYSALQRKANSQYATDDEMNRATDEIGRMEDALPRQHQDLLYGIGQPKGSLNAEDIPGMRAMVTSNTPDQLAHDDTPYLTEKIARILGGNAFDQPGHKIAAVNVLRELSRRGVDPTKTIGSYFTSALRMNPADAVAVLQDRLVKLNSFAGGQY